MGLAQDVNRAFREFMRDWPTLKGKKGGWTWTGPGKARDATQGMGVRKSLLALAGRKRVLYIGAVTGGRGKRPIRTPGAHLLGGMQRSAKAQQKKGRKPLLWVGGWLDPLKGKWFLDASIPALTLKEGKSLKKAPYFQRSVTKVTPKKVKWI